jgi:hypothetical protein
MLEMQNLRRRLGFLVSQVTKLWCDYSARSLNLVVKGRALFLG